MDILLLENGFFMLQENGYDILLESSESIVTRLTRFLALRKIN